MRPFGARGSAAKATGFAAPPRGKTFSRQDGSAGEARQLQNPHSSSGQTALYSGRPAGEGIPHTALLPLLFPTATATLGCGGVPLSVEKENAPFDGVEEKAGAAAFQTLFETPCSALLRGLWPGSRCWPCPLYPLLTPTELRVPPGCSAVLFSLPHPDIRGSVPPILQIPRNHRIAAAKQKQRASGTTPQLPKLPYAVEWSKPVSFHQAKTPVKGAASVPGEARNAAAQPFSLDTIKRRFLFFHGKRERGF